MRKLVALENWTELQDQDWDATPERLKAAGFEHVVEFNFRAYHSYEEFRRKVEEATLDKWTYYVRVERNDSAIITAGFMTVRDAFMARISVDELSTAS